MLRVNDGPVLMNDDVTIQVLVDAVDEIGDIGLGHCFLLQLVVDIVGQVPHLLQPALEEGQVLLPSVVELGLLLFLVDSCEVLLQHRKVVLLVVVEGMKNPHVFGNGTAPL